MKINWPGMSKDRLVAALAHVIVTAQENSCVCDKTGELASHHRKSCWVRMAANDYRICWTLVDKLRESK